MIPAQLIAGAVLVAIAFVGGWKVNGWRIASAEKKAEDAAQKAATAATEAAVTAIKGIEVKYVTIKQQGETITRERVVYSECQHDPDGLRVLNEALTAGQPSTAPSMPGSDTPR